MQNSEMFQKLTIQTMLDMLDVIECFKNPGYTLRVGEVLSKQKQIYEALGINPPA